MVSVPIQKACLELRHLSTSDFLRPRHPIISICLRRFTTRRVNDEPHAFRCIQTGGQWWWMMLTQPRPPKVDGSWLLKYLRSVACFVMIWWFLTVRWQFKYSRTCLPCKHAYLNQTTLFNCFHHGRTIQVLLSITEPTPKNNWQWYSMAIENASKSEEKPSWGSCLGSSTPLGAIEVAIDVTGAMEGPVAGMDPGSMCGMGPAGPDGFCGCGAGPKCPCGPTGPVGPTGPAGPKGPGGMEGGSLWFAAWVVRKHWESIHMSNPVCRMISTNLDNNLDFVQELETGKLTTLWLQ